ncbi:hypothetical protein [Pontibacter pamirensis]|uniref:hypothetical protein n=1 Tax=Pontibacter pamirensis TaxID=2562824 RepID=UPI00138A4DBA|nr:hypothetical protein [Pontibacter pamirensis]
MRNISRQSFLKQSLGLSAIAILNPFGTNLLASPESGTSNNDKSENEFYRHLVQANDKRVAFIIEALNSEIKGLRRELGYDFATLAASYGAPLSRYHKSQELVPYMGKIIQFLLEVQGPDGTLDIGNLGSPPDTAFILEPLCVGTSLLQKNKAKALNEVKGEVKKFILKAGDALAKGGVHTPNHRWVVSSALARINALYPDPKFMNRIQDWLGEGIFIDKDGHYLERSRIYSEVIDRSLITMARLLNMPSLLVPVRKNLEMTYYYLEPNGDLVTTDSRRQDQFGSKTILDYYHHYRYLAILDNNKEFAAIAKFIEGVEGFEEEILSQSLFYFMEEPLLRKELPAPSPPPTNYEKFFTTSNLARIRRGDTTTTIFGGVDWPLVIGSGRSTSPNMFSFRKGDAILKYLRVSSNFFSTGYFRSEGLKKEGEKYVLYKKLEVPYYQPLSAALRKENGDYALSQSIDGRFWNKMDFENRPVSNVKTLETTVTVEEKEGNNELTFKVAGSDNVPVTIELCFKEGGKLVGVTPSDDQTGNNFLEQGMGKYQFGEQTITFGPGTLAHKRLRGLEGEMYTSHFGSLRTEGMHVYLTGFTPFEHKITIS